MSDIGHVHPTSDLPVALNAVRNRLANLGDAIVRAERAQAHLAIALQAAMDAGAASEDVQRLVKLVGAEKPERVEALDRLALLDPER